MLRSDVVIRLLTKIAADDDVTTPTVLENGRPRHLTPRERANYLAQVTGREDRSRQFDPRYQAVLNRIEGAKAKEMSRVAKEDMHGSVIPDNATWNRFGPTGGVIQTDYDPEARRGDTSAGNMLGTTAANIPTSLARGVLNLPATAARVMTGDSRGLDVNVPHLRDPSLGAGTRHPGSGEWTPEAGVVRGVEAGSDMGATLAAPAVARGVSKAYGAVRGAVRGVGEVAAEAGHAGSKAGGEAIRATGGPGPKSLETLANEGGIPLSGAAPVAEPIGGTPLRTGAPGTTAAPGSGWWNTLKSRIRGASEPSTTAPPAETAPTTGTPKPVSKTPKLDAAAQARAALAEADAARVATAKARGFDWKPGQPPPKGMTRAQAAELEAAHPGGTPRPSWATPSSGARRALAGGAIAAGSYGLYTNPGAIAEGLDKVRNFVSGGPDRPSGVRGGPKGVGSAVAEKKAPGGPSAAATPGAGEMGPPAPPKPPNTANIRWGGKGGDVGTYSDLASRVYGDSWGGMKGKDRMQKIEGLRSQYEKQFGSRTLLPGQSVAWDKDGNLSKNNLDAGTADRLRQEGRAGYAALQGQKHKAPTQAAAPAPQERAPVVQRRAAPASSAAPAMQAPVMGRPAMNMQTQRAEGEYRRSLPSTHEAANQPAAAKPKFTGT